MGLQIISERDGFILDLCAMYGTYLTKPNLKGVLHSSRAYSFRTKQNQLLFIMRCSQPFLRVNVYEPNITSIFCWFNFFEVPTSWKKALLKERKVSSQLNFARTLKCMLTGMDERTATTADFLLWISLWLTEFLCSVHMFRIFWQISTNSGRIYKKLLSIGHDFLYV